ncbi:MAG: chaperone modulator CbpM [Sciscionella sp.]
MIIGLTPPGCSLVRPALLDLDTFAATAGLHPDLVRRFAALGLLEPVTDGRGRLMFAPAQVRTAARLQRLRAGLSVNYAALGLVMDLLDRIDELEAAVRQTGARVPHNARAAGVPCTVARLER